MRQFEQLKRDHIYEEVRVYLKVNLAKLVHNTLQLCRKYILSGIWSR